MNPRPRQIVEAVLARGQRKLFLAIGLVSTGLGFVGMVLPVMPTTVFFIIALWAFKKSSPRLEAWLLNHPLFGSTLRDWEEHHCIRPRAKVIALTMIWLTIGASTYLMVHREKWGVAGILLGVAISLTYYILTRPSGPTKPTRRPALGRQCG